jgi:hypothetical protein
MSLRPFACWECGFKSRRKHGCLSVVSVVCCQVMVSAFGWSLVQRSPTECGVSECDREVSIMRRPWLQEEVKLPVFVYVFVRARACLSKFITSYRKKQEMKTEKRIRRLCNKWLSHLIHEICVAKNLLRGFALWGGRKLQYKTGVLLSILEKETACIECSVPPFIGNMKSIWIISHASIALSVLYTAQ